MKIFSALLVLALLLGAAVWKLENPDGGVATLSSQFDTLAARLSRGAAAVVADADSGASAATEASGIRAQWLERLESLDAKEAARSARLERSIEALTERVVSSESELGDVRRDLGATTDAVADIMVDLEAARAPSATSVQDALAAQLEAQALQLDTQASVIEELSRRLAALGEPGPVDGERVDALESGLGELGERLGTLENELLALAAPADAPVAADDGQAARQAAITALRDEIDRQFEAVESRVEALAQSGDASAADGGTEVVSLAGALDETRNRIADLEDRLDTAAGENSVQAETLERSLIARLDALETQLEQSGADAGAVSSQLASLRAETDDLAGEPAPGQTFAAIQESLDVAEVKVFFDFNSTDITDAAADELDAFIEQQQDADAALSIFGLTDRTGPADYNRRLADRRARNVRDYLIENGLGDERIRAATGLGEEAVAGLLADEQGDAGQRAVVIYTTRPR